MEFFFHLDNEAGIQIVAVYAREFPVPNDAEWVR